MLIRVSSQFKTKRDEKDSHVAESDDDDGSGAGGGVSVGNDAVFFFCNVKMHTI